jgi:hypothetical protein
MTLMGWCEQSYHLNVCKLQGGSQMSVSPKLNTVKKSFLDALENSESLYIAVKPYLAPAVTSSSLLKPGQARRIIALAFMTNVAAWEEFVQESFIRYLMGASSPSGGYKPSLRLGACSSIDHAIEVIAGESNYDLEKNYLVWMNWKAVVKRAEVYFWKGEPFSKIPDGIVTLINDSFKIRNRVAHSSLMCKKDFKQVALKSRGMGKDANLTQGYTVGHLLLEPNVRHFGSFCSGQNYFEAYTNMFKKLADLLTP